MLPKTTILAFAFAAARFTIAAPSQLPRDINGCSNDSECAEGEKCLTQGQLQVLSCQPDKQSCATDADCDESQECRNEDTSEITTAVQKCLDRASTMPIDTRETLEAGQCRTDSDCDGEGACAKFLIFPPPEFGSCVGGGNA